MSTFLTQIAGFWSDLFYNSIISPIVNFFAYFFGMFLYGLQLGMFYVIDAVQMVVRKISGLPAYSINGERTYGYIVDGQERNDDLVMAFLESETTQSVFFSILIAAVFLLFITTVIAVLKTEFDTKSNAKGPIFASALKSIVYFALVPVVCYLGIIVSNIVLKTLDGATSRDAVSFSSQVFTAAGHSCNRARESSDFAKQVYDSGILPGTAQLGGFDQEKVAMLIDDAFRRNLNAVGADNGTATIQVVGDWGFGTRNYTFSSFDVKDYTIVYEFYNTAMYNYLIGYVAGLTIMFMLLNLLIGVIRRIFELVILFVVSPAVVS
ncbi:MAG: hypothetical protein J6C13_03885, partial [Clostridia bacterium]|nr:hypothetical protein [Clostridia bacterium]